MPFSNRVRLPMQLHSAQFPEERTVFRKANGVTKTLSVVIRHTYEVETDFMPELWHRRLKIALGHDNISWEGDHYLGDVAQDGDYNIQWPDGVLHYPTAKAECKVQVTPFDATNSNCQTCEEATQLELLDDTVTSEIYGGNLQEDEDYTGDLADNDLICCYPAVFSLVSFNSDYLTSATINATTGVLSIHTGIDLVSANGILIATYRVACPNGGYDDANVYADFDGTIPGCLAPTNLEVTGVDSDAISYSWDAPEGGTLTYYWEIYEGSGPVGSPVQTGTTSLTTIEVAALDPDTEYYFQIRQNCYGSNSNFIDTTESTSADSGNCGEYTAEFNSGGSPGDFAFVTYEKCTGGPLTIFIPYGSSRIFCMFQTAPGIPFSFTSSVPVDLIYNGLC